jgi:RNA-splicing ligase RtcB
VLDEIPGAYKDIDRVMANQSDLVDHAHTQAGIVRQRLTRGIALHRTTTTR